MIWRGPLREDERSAQIAEVEGFISRRVDGIVLAPLDDTALATPVADAKRAGIPVVIIDSAREGERLRQLRGDRQSRGRPAGW